MQFVQQAPFTVHQADVHGQQTVSMSGATQAGIVGPHDCRHTVDHRFTRGSQVLDDASKWLMGQIPQMRAVIPGIS
jgi:hypothetical protein